MRKFGTVFALVAILGMMVVGCSNAANPAPASYTDVTTASITHGDATALIVTITGGTFKNTLAKGDFSTTLAGFVINGVSRIDATHAIVWSSATATGNGILTVKGSAQASQASSVTARTDKVASYAAVEMLQASFTPAAAGKTTITLTQTGAAGWSTTATDYILIKVSDVTISTPTAATNLGVLTVAAMAAEGYIILAKPATTAGTGAMTAAAS